MLKLSAANGRKLSIKVSIKSKTTGEQRVIGQMVEQLGATSLIHDVLDETTTDVSISIPGYVTSDIGAVLAFNVDHKNIHIFQSDTGKRIPQ